MKIALLSINHPSLQSALRLYPYIAKHQVVVYAKEQIEKSQADTRIYNKLDDILPDIWQEYDAIIAIIAIGAIVRKIAPLLTSKSSDPAVVALNLALDKVVPIVGGHLGGANALAEELADKLPGCISFVSTATDQTGTLSFDTLAQQNGWQIENLKALANISNRLLNKKSVKVATYSKLFDTIPNKSNLTLCGFDKIDENTVVIAPHIRSNALTLKPKLTIGIGCNKNTPANLINDAFEQFLVKHNIAKSIIEKIATFEAKRDEKGLLEFATNAGFEIEFYQKDEINGIKGRLSPSASTKFFGLKGVAEPSSILGSRYRQLIIPKEVYHKSITIAGAI